MIQEEKELLLKDLCARLPYKKLISLMFGEERLIGTLYAIYPEEDRVIIDNLSKPIAPLNVRCGGFNICEIKPYLRPMSSMTEEEKKEYRKVCELDTEILANHPMNGEPFPALYNSQDWLNAHHFDYRGLIPMGLAIEVTEENNPYKK